MGVLEGVLVKNKREKKLRFCMEIVRREHGEEKKNGGNDEWL